MTAALRNVSHCIRRLTRRTRKIFVFLLDFLANSRLQFVPTNAVDLHADDLQRAESKKVSLLHTLKGRLIAFNVERDVCVRCLINLRGNISFFGQSGSH
jgi:hypothetical protein